MKKTLFTALAVIALALAAEGKNACDCADCGGKCCPCDCAAGCC